MQVWFRGKFSVGYQVLANNQLVGNGKEVLSYKAWRAVIIF
jgi:hypothetical protein